MWFSHYPKWAGIATIMMVMLSGCVPWPRERPGYNDLCQSEYHFDITTPNGKKRSFLKPIFMTIVSRA